MDVHFSAPYSYMSQLLALEACMLSAEPKGQMPAAVGHICTPLIYHEWEKGLQNHPDKRFRDYILSGIRNGFRIGFDRDNMLKSGNRNLLSAEIHPTIVDEYLSNEQRLGRIMEVPESLQEQVHLNPFGAIPKKHKPDKWRLIVDLSAPDKLSVNDGISKELCSLSYASVDDVVKCIIQVGQGATLAKVNIKQAYRNIPVHPQDRLLLGMRWKEAVFIDKALPFGLHSAPIIFFNG